MSAVLQVILLTGTGGQNYFAVPPGSFPFPGLIPTFGFDFGLSTSDSDFPFRFQALLSRRGTLTKRVSQDTTVRQGRRRPWRTFVD
jgi:hypothetical protein